MAHPLFRFDPHSPEHRWRSLLASVAVMCTAGAVYLFSSYGADLAQRLDLSDTELNNVSTAGNIGLWSGIVAGIFLDHFGVHKTCRGGAIISLCGMLAMGTAVHGLFPTQSHWFVAFANFVFCQGQSWSYLAGMKGALRNFDSRERGRLIGTLVCFFAISAGILSQCYKAVFQGYVPLHFFFYAMGAAVFFVQFTAAEFLRLPTQHRPLMSSVELVRLRWIQGFGAAIAVWVFLMSIVHLYATSHAVYVALWAVMMALLLLLTHLGDAFRRALPIRETDANVLAEGLPDAEMPPEAAPERAALALEAEMENPFRHTPPPPRADPGWVSGVRGSVADAEMAASGDISALGEVTPRQRSQTLTPERRHVDPRIPSAFAIASPDDDEEGQEAAARKGISIALGGGGENEDPASPAPPVQLDPAAELHLFGWTRTLLVPEFLCLAGYIAMVLAFPITALNNSGQIVASLQPVPNGTAWAAGDEEASRMQSTVGLIVAGFATFNAAGRVAFGFLADKFSAQYPRPAWLLIPALLLLASNALLIFAFTLPIFYVAMLLAALGMGGVFALGPLTVVEVFGLDKYGRLWGVLTAGPCVSTIVFSTLVAGRLSDRERSESFVAVDSRRYCLGSACYHVAFTITAIAGCCAIGCGVGLLVQLRRRARNAA